MKKSIKRLLGATCALALLAGAGVALGSVSKDAVKVSAATAEFTLSSAEEVTVDGVTVSFAKGSGSSAPAWYDNGLRLYVSNTITITCESAITGVSFNWEQQGSKTFNTVTADVGTYTHPSSPGIGTWTGEANQIVFTCGTTSKAQLQLNTFSVNYNGGSTAELESLTVSGSMTKSAYTTAESWDPTGLTVSGHYDDGTDKDVTSKVSWSYDPASPADGVTSVVATASLSDKSASSSAQAVTVTRTNPIQALYAKSSGASVDVYGYYVGFLDGTGPVIMDGEYGIVIYNKSADVSSYTAGETILHVTGSISIYKGLYEINSTSISVASGSYDAPATPVVYSTTGNETAEYASRLTTVTGTPTLVSGSFDSDAGTADITMNFAVGTKTVQVFYKKAAQTADAEAFAAIKAAVADSTEITIKGFTGWYNGFQVQMNGYVPEAEDYTAEDFAQDLIDQVSEVCDGWDGETDNHDALEAIWSDLASNDKYPSLPSAEKTKLAEADAVEGSSDVLENAMYLYDFCTAKYNLSNFINGRNPSGLVVTNNVINNTVNSSTFIIVVTVVALISVTSIGALVIIKRRKAN